MGAVVATTFEWYSGRSDEDDEDDFDLWRLMVFLGERYLLDFLTLFLLRGSGDDDDDDEESVLDRLDLWEVCGCGCGGSGAGGDTLRWEEMGSNSLSSTSSFNLVGSCFVFLLSPAKGSLIPMISSSLSTSLDFGVFF